MKASALHVLMLMGCGLLSGCGMAVFESPPGEALAKCDPQFVGHWRFAPPKGRDKAEPIYISVGAECRNYQLNGKELHEVTGSQTSPVFAQVNSQSILALPVANTPPKDPGSLSNWKREGYVYFAYRKQGGSLHLYPVTEKTVAHLIIDDKVPGRVNAVTGVSPQEYEPLTVFVIGTSIQMAEIVQRPDFFHKEAIILLPVAANALPQPKATQTP